MDYHSRVMLLGSCFAENMGVKFDYFKFQATTNPFGIIFNPVSIQQLVSRVVNQHFFTEEDIFFQHDSWHCFEVHSELSHCDATVFLARLNQILVAVYQEMMSMTHCIVTLGTSWVYRWNETQKIVANCHKMPQKNFEKVLLPVSVIQESLHQIVTMIQKVNSNANFVFTISPVRHLKDGFVENTLSKSHLITALHALMPMMNRASYFPSYELMMDELRDYRFYDRDMLHLNSTAIDFIWDRFMTSFTTKETQVWMQEIDAIQKALLHRPFQPESDGYRKFRAKLEERIQRLRAKLPYVSF